MLKESVHNYRTALKTFQKVSWRHLTSSEWVQMRNFRRQEPEARFDLQFKETWETKSPILEYFALLYNIILQSRPCRLCSELMYSERQHLLQAPLNRWKSGKIILLV